MIDPASIAAALAGAVDDNDSQDLDRLLGAMQPDANDGTILSLFRIVVEVDPYASVDDVADLILQLPGACPDRPTAVKLAKLERQHHDFKRTMMPYSDQIVNNRNFRGSAGDSIGPTETNLLYSQSQVLYCVAAPAVDDRNGDPGKPTKVGRWIRSTTTEAKQVWANARTAKSARPGCNYKDKFIPMTVGHPLLLDTQYVKKFIESKAAGGQELACEFQESLAATFNLDSALPMWPVWRSHPREFDNHLLFQRYTAWTPNCKPMQDIINTLGRPRGNVIRMTNPRISKDSRNADSQQFLGTYTTDQGAVIPNDVADTGVHITQFNRFMLAIATKAFCVTADVRSGMSQAATFDTQSQALVPFTTPPHRIRRAQGQPPQQPLSQRQRAEQATGAGAGQPRELVALLD